MRHILRGCLIAIVALAPLAASEHRGVVKFGGLPVPGATVTATQGDKKLIALTDPQGVYTFPNLADGVWNIEVEMLCFEPARQEVAVAANAPVAQWDLKLLPFDKIKAAAPAPPPTPKPAAVETAVAAPTTAAPAPPASTTSKKNKKKGQTAAPANPEGGFQRASLNASANGGKPADSPAETAGGGAEEGNAAPSEGLLINGSVNNGASSPFAQSAAFGNNRRNGRSLYNANAGITFDNSVLDARSFSLTGQDTPKPAYDRFTGLFSLGGPLPLIHAQNRPMFVLNYQWVHNRNAATESALMPSLAQRAGDFSNQAGPIYDPSTGLPVPGNVIPRSRISPQAAALMALYPLPNFSSPQYNYQVPIVSSSHQDAMQTRLNKTVGRMNQVNGMFAFQSIRSATPNVLNFQDTARQLGLTTNISWLHRFSQRTFLTLGAQYSRQNMRNTPFFAYSQNISGDAGIPGNNQAPAYWGPPNLSFASGIQPLSDGNQSLTRNQTAGVTASVFWSHSPHNISYGVDIKRQQLNLLSEQNPRGGFSFTGASTEAVANGVRVPGTGSDFAGFLLGVPDTVSLATGNADKYFRSGMYDAYVNDDWRVGPGFTLNVGLRWDFGSPISEIYGRLVNLDVTPGFAAMAPVVASNPVGPLTGVRYPDALIKPDWHGFEPHFGFAWHPILASSLVVRGGYTVAFDTSVYQSIAMQMAQQSPLSKSLSEEGAGLTMATAFNAPPSNTPNTFGISPDFRPGYSQNWQLSLQRDLPGSLVMTATYLGIKGTHGRQEFLPNTYPAGEVNPCPACPSGPTYEISGGNSSRESGQLQLRRRLRAGFTASLNYTFAKAIDDAAFGGRGQGGSFIAQNWLDLEADRALSSFDQRHLVSLQAQYSTGAGLGGGALVGGWKGALFKEWTLLMQMTAGSGTPLTPLYFAAVAGTSCTGCTRPEYTGAPLYAAPAGLSLNPDAYTPPPSGQWGNAGRDTIIGPSQFSLNASLGRTFPIGDRHSLDLRFDATNALNHVTFPSWNTTLSSPLFGLPVNANAMRLIQTTLRFRF